jgi:hypothetical protein
MMIVMKQAILLNFPALGRLRKEGSGYSWAPVVFTDQWDTPAPSPHK